MYVLLNFNEMGFPTEELAMNSDIVSSLNYIYCIDSNIAGACVAYFKFS